MLKINAQRVRELRAASRGHDLHSHLQAAIQLEHATIPVYLSAYFSIKDGAMPEVREILKSVFVEEMLHMAIACNVLNAIGGEPSINRPGFVPVYPSRLPMAINSGLTVHLAPLSKTLVENEFMEIEEPEDPIEFPVAAPAFAAAAAPQFATIGQFYAALVESIQRLGEGIFTGAHERQVVSSQWFPEDELFAVTDVSSATRALELIVRQGEGTAQSPLDPEDEVAHYYRFEQILRGRALVRDQSSPKGFSFTGKPIPFDESAVWETVTDPRTAQFKSGSRARVLVDQCNVAYRSLLNALHDAFNGTPQALSCALGLMYEMSVVAGQAVETRDEVTGKQAAPTFEIQPSA
jgi:hypothetical protein